MPICECEAGLRTALNCWSCTANEKGRSVNAFMSEVDRISAILRQIDLPSSQFVINGSGVLALHGIKRNRPMGDLDIFCATEQWFKMAGEDDWEIIVTGGEDRKRRCDPPYLRKVMFGLEVNVYFQWRRRGGAGDFDPTFYILNAEGAGGWPCVPLQFIMDWKLAQGRNKDLHDVIAIRSHLGIEVTEV